MAYIEKTKVKGKTYYRLAQAIKKGSKVTHRVKYLGKELPSKKKLQQLKEEFLKEITSARYKYLSAQEVESIEQKKEVYRKEQQQLSPLEKEKLLKEFVIRFTYDSSKLSGVQVTLRQTSLILKEGIIPQDLKSVTTVRELENHQKGIQVITTYKGPLTIHFIKKLHRILLAGVDETIAGKTRDELGRNVKLMGTVYVPPKWTEVQQELKNFFAWYKAENRKLHPLELAALVHLRIISLQPFVDGNSRLSRLLMNWILWKKKYPLVNIPIEDLENYYKTLDTYQIEHQEKPFVEYILKMFLEE